ncbi:hypothetical protein VN97_g5430, partial [Penicillium thymicola]
LHQTKKKANKEQRTILTCDEACGDCQSVSHFIDVAYSGRSSLHSESTQ